MLVNIEIIVSIDSRLKKPSNVTANCYLELRPVVLTANECLNVNYRRQSMKFPKHKNIYYDV